jgi:glutamyl-tRNA synthetase
MYRQSERTEIYKEQIQKLLDNGHAYISKEEAIEEGKRGEVIRFKNPNKKVKFHDVILGDIEIDSTDLKDFVIAKDLETPLFHLTVVIDDGLMEVSHVIRGQDHISNTPRQILILEALGFERPVYAHIPLILSPDKSKMSKRYGATSVSEFRELGYLPEAIVNFIALLGWNPGTDQEMWTMEDLKKVFDLEKVQKGGAVFNREKLDWFNKEWIKTKFIDTFATEMIVQKLGISEDVAKRAVSAIAERLTKYSDLDNSEEFGFYKNLPEYNVEKLSWKNTEKQITAANLSKVKELLQGASFENAETIKSAIWQYAETVGRGDVLWPLRVALSGKDKSPDPFTLGFIFGKDETLKRIDLALQKLS